jgi:hypothetical protein
MLGDPVRAGPARRADAPAGAARNWRPEPVLFQSDGTLYAHGLLGHVRAGQNLAVLPVGVARYARQ